MINRDYAHNDYRALAPWYTLPLYFLSAVVSVYALLWIAAAFVETAECWAVTQSTGCVVVWRP